MKKYLENEIKRLAKINDSLEKKINTERAINNEPEQITENILTMCILANIILKL